MFDDDGDLAVCPQIPKEPDQIFAYAARHITTQIFQALGSSSDKSPQQEVAYFIQEFIYLFLEQLTESLTKRISPLDLSSMIHEHVRSWDADLFETHNGIVNKILEQELAETVPRVLSQLSSWDAYNFGNRALQCDRLCAERAKSKSVGPLNAQVLLGSDVVLTIANGHKLSLAGGDRTSGPGVNNDKDIYWYGIDPKRGVGPPSARHLPNIRIGYVRPPSQVAELGAEYEAGIAINYDVVATVGAVRKWDTNRAVRYWVDVQRNGLACRAVEQMCTENDITGLAAARMVPHCIPGTESEGYELSTSHLTEYNRIEFCHTLFQRVRRIETTTSNWYQDSAEAVRQLFRMQE